MHGSVWQWVEDCYAEKLNGAPTDGSAWKEPCKDETASRVVRGGSWNDYPSDFEPHYNTRVSSSIRDRRAPGFRGTDLGFRVARDLPGALRPP
jgi:formylglycine-generating enzyme required for sulfatase activity